MILSVFFYLPKRLNKIKLEKYIKNCIIKNSSTIKNWMIIEEDNIQTYTKISDTLNLLFALHFIEEHIFAIDKAFFNQIKRYIPCKVSYNEFKKAILLKSLLQ